MTVTVEGVPTQISREKICEFIEALGLDPAMVIRLQVELRVIHVEVYATLDGKRFLDGNERARHSIAIEITDDRPRKTL